MCRYIVHSMWEDVEQRSKIMGVSYTAEHSASSRPSASLARNPFLFSFFFFFNEVEFIGGTRYVSGWNKKKKPRGSFQELSSSPRESPRLCHVRHYWCFRSFFPKQLCTELNHKYFWCHRRGLTHSVSGILVHHQVSVRLIFSRMMVGCLHVCVCICVCLCV